MKHTILGAGGSIGNALTYELLKAKADVRLVSRSGFSIPGTESVKADISSNEETLKSIQKSDIVYLLAGLAYDTKVWSDLWPKIMQNTIDGCKKVGAKLIFFDNVYMYGKVNGRMTESTPFNPCSRKGEIRAKIAMHLEEEIKNHQLDAMIARSADFYGPYATKTCMAYLLAIEKLMNGKSAQWLISADIPHSFTYTLDCAKGLVLLSSRSECYNQTWHLPTHGTTIDGKTFITLVANELGMQPNYSILKKWMVWLAGLFNKTIAEIYEMLYQNELAYEFNSSKFNDFFKYQPISYVNGIHETMEFLKQQK